MTISESIISNIRLCAEDQFFPYEGLELHEIAGLEGVGLLYKDTGRPCRTMLDTETGPYIILAPIQSAEQLNCHLFMSLAIIKNKVEFTEHLELMKN